MSKSPYYKTLRQKTDAELRSMIKDVDRYEEEARQVAESILLERKIDIILEDDVEQPPTNERPYDEVRERLFYVNWQAPTIVILIGFGLYFLLGLSFYFNMRDEVVTTLNGRIISRLVAILIIYFAFALVIDGILKGKVWARATYAGLLGLGIVWKAAIVIMSSYLLFPSRLDLVFLTIEIVLVVLLFLQPANSWFEKKAKKRPKSEEILDDL
ncbi:MAG: hypothetical protein NXI10_07175 [bacterium]|nr:hypothetical protein [bacterium]